MRVLVTGGAGFIGSHFAKRLKAAGDDVRVLDKLTYSGNPANLEGTGIELVAADICDAGAVAEAAAGFDAIVNFAAETHVDRSILGATDFGRTEFFGTQVLLEEVRRTGARFVQVSTDEVYGDLAGGGSAAETDPIKPSSPYSVAKAAGDLHIPAYARTFGVNASITRGSNTYGPNQYPEKLIPLMTTNALAGEPLPVYGDGRQRREWLHVRDHCAAVELVLREGAGEFPQHGAPIALPRAAVHAGEARRREVRKLLDKARSVGRVRVVIHLLAERFARREDVVVDERPRTDPGLREEVAAEERSGGCVEEVAAFPAVRQMRRRLPDELVPPEVERLAVRHAERLDVHKVTDGHHRRNLAANGTRPRSRRQKVGEAAALVRLHVRKPNEAKLRHRQHRLDLLPDHGVELSRTGMKQEGLVVDHEVLVEREAAGHEVGHCDIDAISVLGNLVDRRNGR